MIVEMIIKMKLLMESSMVDLELGLNPSPIYVNMYRRAVLNTTNNTSHHRSRFRCKSSGIRLAPQKRDTKTPAKKNRMASFNYAYRLSAVRECLFEQTLKK